MKGFDLTITLLENAVFSERTATEGGHRGLQYIPGAALLGAAANRLYSDASLTQEDKFILFHSGKVRFGNGLPLDDSGAIGYPVPLCWHSVKDGEKFEENGQLLSGGIWNLSVQTMPEGKQPKQIRTCFVTLNGGKLEPHHGLQMKTSIDPDKGRAKEAALFGYDALAAGLHFRASITWDDEIPSYLVDALKKALTKSSLLLGRSRTAEYGKAHALAGDHLVALKSGNLDDSIITLWLLSDLAAQDENGQPTYYPKPDWLGLPKGKILLEKSFIRTRRYSPWNAYRRGPDLERQVIVQGSVLVFELYENLTDEHWQLIARGLGSFLEAGLGKVWLEPPLLKQTNPDFSVEPMGKDLSFFGDDQSNHAQKSDLIVWLGKQTVQSEGRQSIKENARELAVKYKQRLDSARKLKGLDDKTPIGPSASQWGSVGEAAKNAKNEVEIYSSLFDDNEGCCKFKAPGWKDEFFSHTHDNSFAAWIRKVWEEYPDRRLFQHLAREIQSILKEGKRS